MVLLNFSRTTFFRLLLLLINRPEQSLMRWFNLIIIWYYNHWISEHVWNCSFVHWDSYENFEVFSLIAYSWRKGNVLHNLKYDSEERRCHGGPQYAVYWCSDSAATPALKPDPAWQKRTCARHRGSTRAKRSARIAFFPRPKIQRIVDERRPSTRARSMQCTHTFSSMAPGWILNKFKTRISCLALRPIQCSLPLWGSSFAAAPRASRAGLPLCGSGPDSVWQEGPRYVLAPPPKILTTGPSKLLLSTLKHANFSKFSACGGLTRSELIPSFSSYFSLALISLMNKKLTVLSRFLYSYVMST